MRFSTATNILLAATVVSGAALPRPGGAGLAALAARDMHMATAAADAKAQEAKAPEAEAAATTKEEKEAAPAETEAAAPVSHPLMESHPMKRYSRTVTGNGRACR